MTRKIELLAPAKNLEVGMAAINFGADAVYIGGPRFGARESAGNSFKDLEQLTKHAHTYGAKTFLALNTILFDQELEDARQLIWDAYAIGMDAVIIQDMGLLEMDLPPIALHASTQTNNYHLNKVKFMEDVGFERVVLARELSLKQIEAISTQTNVELEAFVHGALCVSLSGQCYMSQALGNRSANRGSCAQPCRKQYDLVDAQGNVLKRGKHLLSLKDMNQSASIAELAKAGVMSFKIEGRLKDIDYVKNITSHYRKEIDAFLEQENNFESVNCAKTLADFTPDPQCSFSRGATNYFLHGREKDIVNFDSPKSMGQRVGTVSVVGKSHFELEDEHQLHNNDGLVFIDKSGKQVGLKVNVVENNKIYPNKLNNVKKGSTIYRNFNHQFANTLKASKTKRKLPVTLHWKQSEQSVQLEITTCDGTKFTSSALPFQEYAQKPERAKEGILRALNKTGDTPFIVEQIIFKDTNIAFIPSKEVNKLRREALEALEKQLSEQAPGDVQRKERAGTKYPNEKASYLENISNAKAEQFYKKHGVTEIEPAFELQKKPQGKTLMVTAHCLKYQLERCPRYNKVDNGTQYPEPWVLQENGKSFTLEFDCKACMMKLIQK